MENADPAATVASHWSNKTYAADSRGTVLRTRWWQHPRILRHINRTVIGKSIDGFSAGLNLRCEQLLKDRPALNRGISVGGGNGTKEMALLRRGIVQKFDIFELAESRISSGREIARKHGFETRIRFFQGDVFEAVDRVEQYDLVHWNNSLHHMLDVARAIDWSWMILRQGGLFYMDDFVGPDRFGWSQQMLLIATAIRQSLPERLLRDPQNPDLLLPRVMKSPNPEKLREADPSEAADSSRILGEVKRRFPAAEIVLTGGIVYNLTLSNVIANFGEEDEPLLERLLQVDDDCIRNDLTHYATALAFKL